MCSQAQVEQGCWGGSADKGSFPVSMSTSAHCDPSPSLWSHRKSNISCFQNHCLQRQKENCCQQVLFGRKGFQGQQEKKKTPFYFNKHVERKEIFLHFLLKLNWWKSPKEKSRGHQLKHLSNDASLCLLKSVFKLLTGCLRVLEVIVCIKC